MFAASLALLAHEFQGAERGLALGVWGAITGAALAIGPVVGGLLVDGLGWRWVFLVNVPVGALLLWLTLTRLPESRDPTPRGARPARPAHLRRRVLPRDVRADPRQRRRLGKPARSPARSPRPRCCSPRSWRSSAARPRRCSRRRCSASPPSPAPRSSPSPSRSRCIRCSSSSPSTSRSSSASPPPAPACGCCRSRSCCSWSRRSRARRPAGCRCASRSPPGCC